LWARNGAHAAAMASERRNARYLPEAGFPERLEVTADLAAALTGAADVLVAVPSHGFRATLEALATVGVPRLSWATKGFELDSGLLPYQVVAEVFPPGLKTAVLSGPTCAREVGAGLPSAMTIASADPEYAQRLAESIST